jgi:PRC-barrel domain protein
MWTYREDTWITTDLNGFNVEALDGEIGAVDEKTNDVGSSYIVVDTGPWIFGKKVLLPAGVIDRIDLDNRRVFVNRTKDEIQNAPEWDESRYTDTTYRNEVGTYYESRTPAATGTRTQM